MGDEIVTVLGQDRDPAGALPVGDPRRPAVRRAVFATLAASALFFVFTAPIKQMAPIYRHAPWENDPYDTVSSFAMFFVPLVAAFCLVPLSLCRTSEPLPMARSRDLIRGCRVALGTIVIALLSDWVSALLSRANRSQWNVVTGVLVGFLALMTVLTVTVAIDLLRAPTFRPAASPVEGSDWLGDMVAVAERETRRLGPFGRPARTVLTWTRRRLLAAVRGHPILAAAVAAAVFRADRRRQPGDP